MEATLFRQFMAVLTKHGLNDDETRHNLVYEWTNGRTCSSKEMYDYEAEFIVKSLESRMTDAARERAVVENVMKEKRSIVLAIAGRVGFFPENSSNFDYFNGWMVKNSIFKKPLWEYKIDELDKLHAQFRGIEAKFNESAQIPGNKAWHIKNKVPMPVAN